MEVLEQAVDTVVEWGGCAKEAVLDYMETEKTVTKKETFIKGALIFCIGVIIGFMIAPIKKGMCIASNNVNSMNAKEEE